MTEIRNVTIPELGEVDEVGIVELLVAVGETIALDDSLVTLESDKATMDVPSPYAGTIKEILLQAGDKVREGAVILTIDAVETAAPAVPKQAPAPAPAAPVAPAAPARRAAPAPRSAQELSRIDFSSAYASPAVRRYARQLGVDLTRVRGTARNERIVKEDVQAYVKDALVRLDAAPAGAALPEVPAIDFSKFGEVTRQALTRIQKISAKSLRRSWLNVPHVTQHDEADITELEAWRQENKARAKADGYSLTPLALLMKATVAALQEFPLVNASLDPDGEHVLLKSYYHLGIAVDTPGGLIVPVIRDVESKSVFELAQELAQTSQQARDGKLKLNQLQGASFTISSLGGIGGTAFTPIVNAPEVAILGVSKHRLQPVWRDDAFVPRLMLPLALSYDHRVIDGALGVRFTTYLATVLADPQRLVS